MKIAVTTICGNDEEKHVDRWLQTTNEADERVVVDCTTKGMAPKLLRIAGVRVVKFSGMFRFDHARNQGLQAISQDVAIVATCDLDEVFSTGWSDVSRDVMFGKKEKRISYNYIHAFSVDGKPSKMFMRDAIHKRNGYRFKYPAHEVLVCDHPVDLVYAPAITQTHLQDLKKPRSYLPLLELSVAENPGDAFAYFSLMRELFRLKMFIEFREAFSVYEKMNHKPPHQNMAIHIYMAESEMVLFGNAAPERLRLIKCATEICPALREPWIELADACIDLNDFKGAKAALENALEIKVRAPLSVCSDRAWLGYPQELLKFCDLKIQEEQEEPRP